MPRITRVYTRTGDDGSTGLGSGGRVSKSDPRMEAIGSVDELSAFIGVALAAGPDERLKAPLQQIQNELFHLGADLCVPQAEKAAHPGPKIEPHHIAALEKLMDALSEQLQPLTNFVLPGGAITAAHLQAARAVCRRAERVLVALSQCETIAAENVRYLNRLSDALFVMARYENHVRGQPEPVWNSRA